MHKSPMTVRELRVMMQAVVDKAGKDLAVLAGETNPQIVAVRNKIEAQHDLAEAVMQALGGDRVALRSMGRELEEVR